MPRTAASRIGTNPLDFIGQDAPTFNLVGLVQPPPPEPLEPPPPPEPPPGPDTSSLQNRLRELEATNSELKIKLRRQEESLDQLAAMHRVEIRGSVMQGMFAGFFVALFLAVVVGVFLAP